MSTTSMVHVRVEDDTKTEATRALAAMGLTLSDAVRLFLKRVVIDQALPIEMKVPNAATLAAMEEARAIRAHRFSQNEALFSALDQEANRK